MRLSRLVMLCAGAVAVNACGSDKVTTPSIPPVAQVRFINAVNDTGALDMHAIDQIAFSPVANNLAYRSGTVYFATSVGTRHFRVFPTNTDIAVTPWRPLGWWSPRRAERRRLQRGRRGRRRCVRPGRGWSHGRGK